LHAALLLLLVPLPLQDDEIVKEFKRYFRKYEDTPTRVEAILALEGTESTEVVRVLAPILKDPEPEVVRAAVRVLAGFETRPPVDLILEELESQKKSALRIGFLRAIEAGAYEGARELLVELLEDSDWSVRRHALFALVATEGAEAAAAIEPLTTDREVAVRCAALDGLARIRSERVVAPAVAALDERSWQVRASAIHALARVRHRDAIGPLIDRLGVEEGRLVEDIATALGEITGRGYGHRLEGWQSFWAQYGDTYQIPTDAELQRLRAKQAERRAAYSGAGPDAVSYHGLETPSRSILFVIDVSGSMEQEVSERERYADGGYPSFQRIDIVKTELLWTIQSLEPYVKFNILAFATKVKPWKKGLVGANPLNRSSAASFIDRLEAIGGNSKEDLYSAGLVGTASLEEGKTNTHGALMAALQVADAKRAKKYQVEVDTIFFLSDGKPSTGAFVDTDDILREVAAANELRKVVIHTLAIGEFEKDFMERLAAANGGVFVDLGK
jgi:hypothetical protein